MCSSFVGECHPPVTSDPDIVYTCELTNAIGKETLKEQIVEIIKLELWIDKIGLYSMKITFHQIEDFLTTYIFFRDAIQKNENVTPLRFLSTRLLQCLSSNKINDNTK